MRIGLLADIHGNLPALDAALTTLRTVGVDTIAVAGDTVGYGPFPNECIDTVRANSDCVVAGNHELFLIGASGSARYGRLARESLLWTKQRLGISRLAWLKSLPAQAERERVVVTHGSLASPHEYVVRPRQRSTQLGLLRRDFPAARVLVLGHTHAPSYMEEDRWMALSLLRSRRFGCTRRVLINPGSVGQSRQWERLPKARFAVLDLRACEVRWFAVRYDHAETLRVLSAAGLPAANIHLRPAAPTAVMRFLRRRTDLTWRGKPE